MSFEVGVVVTFNARHHLVGDFGPASLPHGHAYRVEAWVTGAALRDDGTLFDITRLQAALSVATTAAEGRDLNDIPALVTPNPTAEVVARYFFDRVAAALEGQGLNELRIRVWESPEAWAGYAAELT
jgi:6-pyruvoyltetrahydropterin/6-carboxytetrahydropterin synthase